MRNKIKRVWVGENFAKELKLCAANKDKSIIEISEELAEEMRNKNKPFRRSSFSIRL